jgi:Asp-tRNA(Asn)/Glu-tRNA(Gln) amidotransferase C subunit
MVFVGVNGSQPELTKTMKPYELNSSLNDAEGVWIASHGSNRYREWDELRYSMRSVEKYAGHFTNRIQILVNAFKNFKTDETSPTTYGKQWPQWLRTDMEKVQVLSQEEFFGPDERKCLPSFDSLTIENQLYNTKSEVDRVSLQYVSSLH